MGSGGWSSKRYTRYASSNITSKSTREVFNRSQIKSEFNPKDITMRESCDSTDNPESTPIIIGMDVTGSMGPVIDSCMRGLDTLVTEIHSRKPVTDPHIMCMGIGDIKSDSAPLQVTQFEADLRIAEQMKDIWLEGHGGGNGGESYPLAWYFASLKTKIDSMRSRNKKGYIFTIGDEPYHDIMTPSQIKRVMGSAPETDLSAKQLLDMVSEKYNVFHIMVEEGFSYNNNVKKQWTSLIGERAIPISDITKLPEVIVSAMQISEGMNYDEVVASWDAKVSAVVSGSLSGFNLHV